MQNTILIVLLGLLGAFCGFNVLESKKKTRKEGLVRVCVCVERWAEVSAWRSTCDNNTA